MNYVVCFCFVLLLGLVLGLNVQEYVEEFMMFVEMLLVVDEQLIEFDLSFVDGEFEDEFGIGEEQDFELIEGLFEEGVEVFEVLSVYDFGDCCDFFWLLFRNFENCDVVLIGLCFEGVFGLFIDEIFVIGIWVMFDGLVVQVQLIDMLMSYFFWEGDQFYDGEVI